MSTKTVYILGAGFSRAFNPEMPLIGDFKQEIELIKLADNSEYQNLADFANDYYSKSNYKLDVIRDIESLATVILSKKIFSTDSEQEKYSRLRSEILRFISGKISRAQKSELLQPDLLSKFATTARANRSTILTFNYDLLVESVVEHGNPIWLDYGGVESYPSYDFCDSFGFPLEYIKLHGSLNWFKIKGASEVNLNSVKCVDIGDRFYPIHKNDIPVFIPMAHAKDSFLTGTLYSTIWAYAINKLQEADAIHFIGYGFPQTDLNNLFTFLDFKSAIKNVIIYSDNEQQRLSDMFGPNVVKKMDAKAFIQEHLNESSNATSEIS